MKKILKNILIAGLALGFLTLPQAGFADHCCCDCSNSDGVIGFPADAIFQQLLNNRIFQVRTETVALFETQAALLHDGIGAALGLPATQPALTAVLAALQLNSQLLANYIVSFNPSQAINAANLASLFFQFDQQLINFAQNPVGLQNVIVAQLEFTAAQITNLIAVILPGINPASLAGAYNFYIAGLISQVNFFATQQPLFGIEAEIVTRAAAGVIGTYVAVGELIQERGIQWLSEQIAN